MSAPQADGCYPRVDGRLLQSGKFSGMIVSLVGRFVPSGQDVGFRCADNVQIRLSIEHSEYPTIDMQDGPVVEVVGQVMDGGEVALFVTRELSKDMDLAVYSKMLEVQHNPKFAHYFTQ